MTSVSSVSLTFELPVGELPTLVSSTMHAFRGRQNIPSLLVTDDVQAACRSGAEVVILIGAGSDQLPDHVYPSTFEHYPETLQHVLGIYG